MSRRDGSITIGMVAAVALVAAAPVPIAELVGGDALAVVVSVTSVAAGILWSRKPISQRYRSALDRHRVRGRNARIRVGCAVAAAPDANSQGNQLQLAAGEAIARVPVIELGGIVGCRRHGDDCCLAR